MKRKGFAQIPIMIGLLIMAVAVPVATKLVQQNQENRGKATGSGCTNDASCGHTSSNCCYCSKTTSHPEGQCICGCTVGQPTFGAPTSKPAVPTTDPCSVASGRPDGCRCSSNGQCKNGYCLEGNYGSSCSSAAPTKVPTAVPTNPCSVSTNKPNDCPCSYNNACKSGYCAGACKTAPTATPSGCNTDETCVQGAANCLNGTVRGSQGICKTTTGGILNQTVDGICCKPAPTVNYCGKVGCPCITNLDCPGLNLSCDWSNTKKCVSGVTPVPTVDYSKACEKQCEYLKSNPSGYNVCYSACLRNPPTLTPTGTSACVKAGGSCYSYSSKCCPGSYCSSSRICVSSVGAGTPVPTTVATCGKRGFRCCSSGTKCTDGSTCDSYFCVLPSPTGIGVTGGGTGNCSGNNASCASSGCCSDSNYECRLATGGKWCLPKAGVSGTPKCTDGATKCQSEFSNISYEYKCVSGSWVRDRRCDTTCSGDKCTGTGVGNTGTSNNPTPTSGSGTGTTTCTQCPGHADWKAKGDVDCSGTITINDFANWKSEFVSGSFGEQEKNSWGADFDCDGKVTINDASIWKANFIKSLEN